MVGVLSFQQFDLVTSDLEGCHGDKSGNKKEKRQDNHVELDDTHDECL